MGSKKRPLWYELPEYLRAEIEGLIGGTVVEAVNCPGGFSPGFASMLTMADGGGAFVKAMEIDAWPVNAEMHRDEVRVTAALPRSVGAPEFRGSFDDGRWIALAFEAVDGADRHRRGAIGISYAL